MKKILLTILLLTASTLIYSQSMNLNNNKIRIVESTMGLGITPTSRLHVFGNGTASNLFKLYNNRGTYNDSSIIVKANGGVILGDSSYYLNGIINSVSDSRLTIVGGTPLRLLNPFAMGYTSLKWSAKTDKDTIADYAQIMGVVEKNTYGSQRGSLYFQTAGGVMQTKVIIDSSGYVGIGTTTPTYRLDVFGNGGTDNLLKVSNDINSTYDSTFVVNKVGKVGIGTANPSTKLHIVSNEKSVGGLYSVYTGNVNYSAISGHVSGSYGTAVDGTVDTDGIAGNFYCYSNGIGLKVGSISGYAIVVTNGDIVTDSTRHYNTSTTLSDNEVLSLPTGYSWKGEIDVDSLGYTLFTAQIRCDANGTPYLEGVSWKRWSSKTYVEVGSTDGYFNIYDAGSGMAIKNSLGYTIKATLRFRTKQ